MPFVDLDPQNVAVGARVRGARLLHGQLYEKRKALTDALNLPRFGDKLLGQVERGERKLYEHEAVELGRVLEVEADWLLYGAARPEGLVEINVKLDVIARHLGIDTKMFATALAAVAGQPANGASHTPAPARDAAGQRTRDSVS